MSLLARRREFLAAFRKTGSIEESLAALNLDPGQHSLWMEDWLYRGAFADIQKERKLEAEGKLPPPPPPKIPKRMGRPPKPRPENPPPKRPPGRPRKNPILAAGSPDEPAPESAPLFNTPPVSPDGHLTDRNRTIDGHLTDREPAPAAPEPPPERPVMVETLFEGNKGYVKLYTPEGEVPVAPEEPEKKPKRREQEPNPEPTLEMTIASDEQQRALVDEYGELDRRMQLRATDTARYESLKKAIKSWFAGVPPDADGTVEGEVYLLHLSACERERKLRSIRDLVEELGLDRVLDLAVVPIGQLENMIGKDRVSTMTIETRTGSRRIKAIPKRPAAIQAG